MGAFSRDSSNISVGDSDHQIAPEKEGVSIFFGRSSIETVKSFVVTRCNTIPREFEEDVSRAPSSGSVARKAAFFDHYIRSVSLEKKIISTDEKEQGSEEEEEKKEVMDQEHRLVECSSDLVEETMDPAETKGEEEEQQQDLVEDTVDVKNQEQEEEFLLASAAPALVNAQYSMESTIYLEQNSFKEEEEPTASPATKLEVLNVTDQGREEKNNSAAPATAKTRSRKPRSTRTGAAPGQVMNKWKSKHGLIPGARAAQVTSKTAMEQSPGRKAAAASSRVGRIKNESAASAAAAAAPVAVPASNPKDKEKSGRVNGSGTANGFVFRSNERAEKRREFNRRMEEKQSAREAEKNKMQAKTQEEMQVEIKELRRGLNFKATPMPGFYHEQPAAKTDATKPQSRSKPLPLRDHPSGKLKKAAGARTTASAIAVS